VENETRRELERFEKLKVTLGFRFSQPMHPKVGKLRTRVADEQVK